MFKYLVMSDIHLGHHINKTPYIVNNLNKFFKEYYRDLSNLNTIFIAGDIFDRLLSNSSSDYLLSTEWLTELILHCKNNRLKLRILEGTPSHDWKQAKLISSIIKKLNIDVDYLYIDTLHIEYMKEENIYILYIPDEYKPKAEDTLKEVKKLMRDMNIDKVDIAIMHGQFEYQLPMVKLESSHSENEYLNLVKHYISIGHIHTPSICSRILAQGSFDRLQHNEEEDKGAMVITIFQDSPEQNAYKFLKNKYSMIFKTIRFKDEDLDVICNRVRKVLDKLPIYSNIKIICDNEDILYKSVKILSKEYTGIRIKAERSKKVDTNKRLLKKEIINNSLVITESNIKELLVKELDKYNLSKEEYSTMLEELEHLM